MATASIAITIEVDVPPSGSKAPDLGYVSYYIKKWIEQDAEIKGKPRVVDIEIHQTFPQP
jgi:hypothetical protein